MSSRKHKDDTKEGTSVGQNERMQPKVEPKATTPPILITTISPSYQDQSINLAIMPRSTSSFEPNQDSQTWSRHYTDHLKGFEHQEFDQLPILLNTKSVTTFLIHLCCTWFGQKWKEKKSSRRLVLFQVQGFVKMIVL